MDNFLEAMAGQSQLMSWGGGQQVAEGSGCRWLLNHSPLAR